MEGSCLHIKDNVRIVEKVGIWPHFDVSVRTPVESVCVCVCVCAWGWGGGGGYTGNVHPSKYYRKVAEIEK